jgi:cytochrome P450
VGRLRVFWYPIHVLFAPGEIEAALATRARSLVKGRGLRAADRVFGKGLLTSEGELWARQRSLIQPAFHRERIQGYARTMSRLAAERAASLAPGQTRDLHAEMMSLTLAIVGETLFGSDVAGAAGAVGEALGVALEEFPALLNPLRRLLSRILPTPRARRLEAAVDRLDAIVLGLVAERRRSADSGGGSDVLSMLLAAGMDDRQVRDEAMTLFLAGHETTALALTFALHLLALHPEADARAASELASLGGPAGFDDLPRLPYLDAVVKEALRLYPPAWAITRLAIEDVDLAGLRVRKGDSVLVTPWVTHRDARLFPEPQRFRPERWLDSPPPPRFAYLPFGAGPRVCIGASFAQTEAVLVLAALLSRFRFELARDPAVELQASITLRPKGGMPMTLKPRG